MAKKISKKITGWAIKKEEDPKPEPITRPEVLDGKTYKIKNAAEDYNIYMTVNWMEGRPFEVFLDSSHTDSMQWMKALGRMMSAILRANDPNLTLSHIADQLMHIHSSQGYYTGGKGGFVPGVIYHIGKVLKGIEQAGASVPAALSIPVQAPGPVAKPKLKEGYERFEGLVGSECPTCGEFTVFKDPSTGCTKCVMADCSFVGECG